MANDNSIYKVSGFTLSDSSSERYVEASSNLEAINIFLAYKNKMGEGDDFYKITAEQITLVNAILKK